MKPPMLEQRNATEERPWNNQKKKTTREPRPAPLTQNLTPNSDAAPNYKHIPGPHRGWKSILLSINESENCWTSDSVDSDQMLQFCGIWFGSKEHGIWSGYRLFDQACLPKYLGINMVQRG